MTDPIDPAKSWKVAVVIPSYKVTKHILGVISGIGESVSRIYVVDDKCPDGSGRFVEAHCRDPRVRVLYNDVNMGVGGAVMNGYRAGIDEGMDILVKMDGDGQMDPGYLPLFLEPILNGDADYTKGNRFWDLTEIRQMPLARRLGNLALSFMTKLSTGYWDSFDPTNGYTAIHSSVAAKLPFDSISSRYFFETDMLFRLNTVRAAVTDIPMDARYGDEVSGLKISSILGEFAFKHARNFVKRIAYNYFLRDLSIASVELLVGVGLLVLGLAWGGWNWAHSAALGTATPVGTIMICTVAVVSGLQFLLAFVGYDIANTPRRALHGLLLRKRTMIREMISE